jgi:cell wall-associated NlpC family hydrolase
MRFIWLIFVALVVAMLGLLPRHKPAAPNKLNVAAPGERVPARTSMTAFLSSPPRAATMTGAGKMRRDSLVFFAMQQLGTNYCYAGTTPATGFDCSGFVQYVFSHFNVPVPHSTALLIDVGQPVPREQAQPGDIVVFTGTAKTSTTPGHAGIVVTAGPQGPLRFVHSSSARHESGVKISQVEGTDYERRFMQVRRVVGLIPDKAATQKGK